MRSHRPTLDWLSYIVRANAKQRFAVNDAGTHIRAVQGHSVPIDSSKLLRQLSSGDIGDLVPTHALHSTYFSCVPSIMKKGLLPGGTRGERFRRHVHLAMSHSPAAGLREGSDVILEIDLMRAHNVGCVFYVSDNNVILTEDCIPPPCIVRAKRTSNGGAYELCKFRAAYKRVCSASSLPFSADMRVNHLTNIEVISAKSLMPFSCRCISKSRTELSCPPGLKAYRPRCINSRRKLCSLSHADRSATASSTPSASKWGAWPLRLVHHSSALHSASWMHLVPAQLAFPTGHF